MEKYLEMKKKTGNQYWAQRILTQTGYLLKIMEAEERPVPRVLSETEDWLYEKFMDLTANPMDFLDAKPFRKRSHYNPENYRTSIADPMMITLTVLVSSIAYFIATMQ